MFKNILISVLFSTIILTSCPDQDQFCISCFNSRCQACIGSFVNSSGVCEQPTIKTDKCLTYSSDESC